MVIISKKIINQLIEKHSRSKNPLLEWYLKTKEADWADFNQLKKIFPSADYVGNGLYVFNIGGGKYRLIARIIFRVRTIYIRFVGTHAEYNKVKLSDL